MHAMGVYFQLLVLGVVAIYVLDRVVRWMYRRGWVQWKPRGTSSALGNAVMQVQIFYQPQVREVLEQRLREAEDAEESGDPPSSPWDDHDQVDVERHPDGAAVRER